MAKQSKAKEQKGTNGYVAQINSALRETLSLEKNATVPVKYHVLIQKTAMDMLMLHRIVTEIETKGNMLINGQGSKGQPTLGVNPLLPYYQKMSAQVTDDLYNLGLTARKQAAKNEDNDVEDNDPMRRYYDGQNPKR